MRDEFKKCDHFIALASNTMLKNLTSQDMLYSLIILPFVYGGLRVAIYLNGSFLSQK